MQQKIRTQIKVLTAPQCSFQPPLVKAFRLDRYKGFYELRIRLRQMVRIIFYINTEGAVSYTHLDVYKRQVMPYGDKSQV